MELGVWLILVRVVVLFLFFGLAICFFGWLVFDCSF